ncbi:MAG: 3-hexulose-6-phosphate synthase [Tessaracoccus sp.]|uniref:3-hexulose-6-phosphate synthase n=1 Tax=Tessaracoccus sp. TaxID=1971211 RepID=UPI001EBE7D48|nr:3-hexulose-6-phosphate synthase [Tessaracoccus sp.]MBK7821045.1 3-hexulose-6-phosphate synthase [Tessaracoccus sp.]
MKIQLAIDDMALAEAVSLCVQIADYVDIVEIGTPMIIQEGMRAVRAIREVLPDHVVLADTKIMDAGAYEADLAFDAGANYCTVLGVTDDLTVMACLEAAAAKRAGVFVDLICVPDVARRTRELEKLGVDLIAVHTGVDRQAEGVTPFAEFLQVEAASSVSVISVAGGINEDSISQYLAEGCDIVVIGAGITRAADPVEAARRLSLLARRKAGHHPLQGGNST